MLLISLAAALALTAGLAAARSPAPDAVVAQDTPTPEPTRHRSEPTVDPPIEDPPIEDPPIVEEPEFEDPPIDDEPRIRRRRGPEHPARPSRPASTAARATAGGRPAAATRSRTRAGRR